MLNPSLQFEGPKLLGEDLTTLMHYRATIQQQPGENSSTFQLIQVKLGNPNIFPTCTLQTLAVSGQQHVQDNPLRQATAKWLQEQQKAARGAGQHPVTQI